MSGIEEAKRRIKKCLDNQETELDLYKCDLEDLDVIPELFDCYKLVSLKLGCEGDIFSQQLKKNRYNYHTEHENNKEFECNSIKNIPKKISLLSNLENLSIHTCEFSENHKIDLEVLAQLINLKTLNLFETIIVNEYFISKLTNLKFLDLGYSNFRQFEALNNLTKLVELNLSNTDLINIEFLKNYPNLTELYVHGNKISDFTVLLELKNFKLDIEGNDISRTP